MQSLSPKPVAVTSMLDSADAAAAYVPFPGKREKLHTILAGSAEQFCNQRQSQHCILYMCIHVHGCIVYVLEYTLLYMHV